MPNGVEGTHHMFAALAGACCAPVRASPSSYLHFHVAHSVVATCRSPESAADLQHLLKEHSDRLMLTAMDVVDENSIQVRLPSHA